MPLSLNEIRKRATEFSKEWENVTDERAEAQTFWNNFFNIFGVSRKRVASFEKPVKKADGHQGFIDLLWKGIVLVEHKSKGKDLETAYKQAKDYFPGLKDEELPRYIVVSNFQDIKLFDLESNTDSEFKLKDLYKNINLFGFISGYQQKVYKDQEPVNIKAAELMGGLHDALLANGYQGHELEVMLVRLLFCLFAEDTTIFEKQQFTEYIELRTNPDGSDLGIHLGQLFQTLNAAEDKRQKNLDEQVAAFPYVNGSLFAETINLASFNSEMRSKLLKCCYFDWSIISPAIFGSMFQSVMNPKERRNLGAHYTSEKNIRKVIDGLFLDELKEEFENIKTNKSKLIKFQEKIAKLKFLDPACGSGNFLIITYRELRLLEIEILKILFRGQYVTDVSALSKIDVDAFYGIEYEEFASQIAQVAMWLIDHQMNMKLSAEFGEYYKRLPLRKSATIVHGNALRIDWQSLLNPVNSIYIEAEHVNIYKGEEPVEKYKVANIKAKTVTIVEGAKPKTKEKTTFDYILGNPPFIGTAYQSKEQKEDMARVFNGVKSFGMLDYVCAWYIISAKVIQNSTTQVSFVSTNSISQGEQPAVLWSELLKLGAKIKFSHRTFKWNNEAKGKAAVHVVVIGFQFGDSQNKTLYEYHDISGEPLSRKVKNINPYLVAGDDLTLASISKPICSSPIMQSGSALNDGGFLILTEEEVNLIVNADSKYKKLIKKFYSGQDFLNGSNRWCLWLKFTEPSELKSNSFIVERLKKVKEFRENSSRTQTKRMAAFPYLFSEERQPTSDFLLIPKVSSENRTYIPIGYMTKDDIITDKNFFVPKASSYHFGVLTSLMHMTWMRYVCGRLKSDYSYSNTIVYNNFPWPQDLPKQKIQGVAKLAQQVLKVRERYPKSSLADLYDPLTMPADLIKAHQDLDKFVDTCYRAQPFDTEMQRIEFLFDLYKQYTQPLFGSEKKKKGKK
ncbi:MAG: class I SAM-dependent DNA methyltransferase [Cytophagales bacterium]|nr:class I SAM-dependent DNA methyltransferase [Cytophagales bacterium]MCA6367475.1 class I SAM-dependent DNA methyltransferase [Cytophagales bacterium]MCA6376778.1 class I SAM-dependent DNA methyltransferase [Cytophagales bacterium]